MPDDPMITDERPQRHYAGAWVVLLIGIVGLIIGVTQWRGSFGKVFATQAKPYETPSELEKKRLEESKTKDTDADGLNDYEESLVYLTSPYLADSDSDGADDKTELARGEDPNCPAGKECGALAGALELQETSSASSAAALAKQEQEILKRIADPSPEEIRQLLLQSGIASEDLQAIDDTTLLQLYRESLVEAQANLSPQQ